MADSEEFLEAVRNWFDQLGRCCAAVDYASARAIFDADVVSFGTRAAIVTGLDRLEQEQWRGIWPNISDFKIDLDSVRAGGSGGVAWGVAVWDSIGYDVAGNRFPRPGRASVVLRRSGTRWLCIHSHFSLKPGTPPRTFGPGAAR